MSFANFFPKRALFMLSIAHFLSFRFYIKRQSVVWHGGWPNRSDRFDGDYCAENRRTSPTSGATGISPRPAAGSTLRLCRSIGVTSVDRLRR